MFDCETLLFFRAGCSSLHGAGVLEHLLDGLGEFALVVFAGGSLDLRVSQAFVFACALGSCTESHLKHFFFEEGLLLIQHLGHMALNFS